MSRGFGSVQRDILGQLEALPAGEVLLVGDGGPSYRRAAYRLAADGVVVLRRVLVGGRWRVGVRALTVLERIQVRRQARGGTSVACGKKRGR